MLTFSILIQPAPDLYGQWIAHCLEWDIVTQGDSPTHAARMIAEAVLLAIEEDKHEEDLPDRPQAPSEYWDLFLDTLRKGQKMNPADVDRLVGSKSRGGVLIASVLYVREFQIHPEVPPPFMIAEIQNQESLRSQPTMA